MTIANTILNEELKLKFMKIPVIKVSKLNPGPICKLSKNAGGFRRNNKHVQVFKKTSGFVSPELLSFRPKSIRLTAFAMILVDRQMTNNTKTR